MICHFVFFFQVIVVSRNLRWRLDRLNDLLDKERERAARAKERVGELERSIDILRWRLERRVEVLEEENRNLRRRTL